MKGNSVAVVSDGSAVLGLGNIGPAGALDTRVRAITDEMKLRAARAIAGLIARPTPRRIIPGMFDPRLVRTIARTIR